MSKEPEMLRELAKLQDSEIAHGRTFPGHRDALLGYGDKMMGEVDLRAILRRLEAAERVCEKAGFIPCEMLARFLDNEDAKGRWPSSGHDNQAQRDLRSLDAALRAYRALDGEETQ